MKDFLLTGNGEAPSYTSAQATLATEIIFDVYQGALRRWWRNGPSTPGGFVTELNAATDMVFRDIERSLSGGE